METITNKQMCEYTTYHIPFRNNTGTVFAEEPPNSFEGQDLYVVYSYGEHFPIYVYDYQ